MAMRGGRAKAAMSKLGDEPDLGALEDLPPPEGAEGGGEVETALAKLESAVTDLPPEKQDAIRMHIDAIRGELEGGPSPLPGGAPLGGATVLPGPPLPEGLSALAPKTP